MSPLCLLPCHRYNPVLHAVVTFTDDLGDKQANAAHVLLSAPSAALHTTHTAGAAEQPVNTSNAGSSAGPPGNRSPPTPQQQPRLSLLTGIPYGLKDLIAVPGYPTSWGLSALRNRTINTVRCPAMPALRACACTACGSCLWRRCARCSIAGTRPVFPPAASQTPRRHMHTCSLAV